MQKYILYIDHIPVTTNNKEYKCFFSPFFVSVVVAASFSGTSSRHVLQFSFGRLIMIPPPNSSSTAGPSAPAGPTAYPAACPSSSYATWLL